MRVISGVQSEGASIDMKFLLYLTVFGILAAPVFADGLTPMKLDDVLPRAKAVVLVEIVSTNGTIVERKDAGEVKSVTYTYNIKCKVAEEIRGTTPKDMDLKYEMIVVKGVWLSWPGSGLEGRMKPNEKYVLLLESTDGDLQLLRAEELSQLDKIKKLLGKQDSAKPSAVADEWQAKLQAAIRQFDSKAVVVVENGTYIYRYHTQTFKIHAIDKTGHLSEVAHDEEGPNVDGLLLRVTLHDKPYQGAAEIPQDLRLVYWTTFINSYPVTGGKYLHMQLSYGGRTDRKLLEAIKTCFGPVLPPVPGAINRPLEKPPPGSGGEGK